MKNNILFLIIILGIIFGTVLYLNNDINTSTNETINNTSTTNLKWDFDLNSTLNKSKNSNKKVLVFFTASYCSYCSQLETGTFTDKKVQSKLSNDYLLVKIDISEYPNLSSKYSINGVPTLAILNSDATITKKIEGYKSPNGLLTELP